MEAPGRTRPFHYRYSPEALRRAPDLRAETLYVIGGLYGNPQALEAAIRLARAEDCGALLVFNGDFNWLNVDPAGFQTVNEWVLSHVALRGNVETELAAESAEAGCGCSYPDWVDDAVVERSNAIMARLRETARRFPQIRERLGALPMHRVAEVGGMRVGIVHGDAESLSGWGFSQESLADPAQRQRVQAFFGAAGVRIFASTHTCPPVAQDFLLPQGRGVVINNGAAGMPNFRGARYGLLTRISTRPPKRVTPAYGIRIDHVYVDAVPLYYDHARWQTSFLANWPLDSPAYQSYFDRIIQGPRFDLKNAARGQVARTRALLCG